MAAAAPAALSASPDPAAAEPGEGAYALVQDVSTATYDRMLGLYPIPGAPDQAVVITQDGILWRVSLSGAFQPAAFGNLSSGLYVGDEEGLVGLAFSPAYQTDGRVYVYRTLPPRSAEYRMRDVVSRFQVVNNALVNGSEVPLIDLDDRELWHVGGQLAFGPDGYLYIGIGDEGRWGDGYDNGQNKAVLFGKVLRIHVTGQSGYLIPSDNPFVDGPGGNRDEIFAYGFRNPWRFSFDRATGNLWAGDVGQDQWEEVDRLIRGGNYGWRVFEGNHCHVPSLCPPPGYVAPHAVYCHTFWVPECTLQGTCAIIGGFVYRGAALAYLRGYYIYADYCGGQVWAVDTVSPPGEPVLLVDSPYLISSLAELPSGELLALTFNNAIYRLSCAVATDTDGDGAPNACEPDDDNDSWSDGAEAVIGTDPLRACGTNAWPPDMDNDNEFDTADFTFLTDAFGDHVPPAAPRVDIAPDPPNGLVDTADIARLTGLFGRSCGT